MNQASYLSCKYPLSLGTPLGSFVRFLNSRYLRHIEEGKVVKELVNICICGINPELIKGIGRRSCRIQPDSAFLSLTKLASISLGHQRQSQAKNLLLVKPAGQIDARGNIAPLVGTTYL